MFYSARYLGLVSSLFGFALLAGGCSGDSAATADSGTGNIVDAAPEQPSRVRVAHFAPDAPPVDFCFVPANGMIIGPVLAQAGLSAGVSFGSITQYLPVGAEVYTVRIIGAGTDCGAPVFEYPNVAVPGGGFSITAAALGYLDAARGPALELVFWIDDNAPAPPNKVRIRTLHGAPGTPSLDIGVLAPNAAVLGDEGVVGRGAVFKVQATPPYVTIDPLRNRTLRAQQASDAALGVNLSGIDLPSGTTATAFVIGPSDGLRIMLCIDSAGNGACTLN